jgi:putative PEP-CTERM system histidine kinase
MELIGIFGYLLSACAYFIFFLLLFAAGNKTLSGRIVLLQSIVVLSSSVVSLLQIKLGFPLELVFGFETIKLTIWILLILITRDNVRTFSQLLSNSKVKIPLISLLFVSISLWLIDLYVSIGSKYLFLLFIVLNLWVLVLLEQLYRNLDMAAKWAIWPLIIGVGTTTIFDFVMFSQALMLNQLDFSYWYVRGAVAALAMPFILISTRRVKNWSLNVFVSRNVVFYSSMLMIAGIYLLVMAFAGYVINYLGGDWGKWVSIAFLILGGVFFAVLLITESLRRRVKVFIAKNFFANRYEYRDEWLNLIEKIETTNAESYYQMATDILMSKLNAEGGAIIKNKANLHFEVKYAKGVRLSNDFDTQLTSFSHFCQSKGWIIDVDEYELDPNMYPELTINLDLCRSFNLRFLVPIFIGKKFYGFFILTNVKELKQLNWEDRDLLFAVSKQLGNFISLHEANDELAQARQFDAFNRMSAFLIHDLKNVQAQLSLITMNAEKHRDNPAFVDDVFETVESATERLAKVLTQLSEKKAIQSKNKMVNLEDVICKVITQRNVEKPQVIIKTLVPCSLTLNEEMLHSVLNHLIQNAQEATSDNGWVKVNLSCDNDIVCINITDNGSGMSATFIEQRLFKPFDTTKGNAGMGIGAFEAKQFIESIAGSISVSSCEGQGTTFTIKLPIQANIEA